MSLSRTGELCHLQTTQGGPESSSTRVIPLLSVLLCSYKAQGFRVIVELLSQFRYVYSAKHFPKAKTRIHSSCLHAQKNLPPKKGQRLKYATIGLTSHPETLRWVLRWSGWSERCFVLAFVPAECSTGGPEAWGRAWAGDWPSWCAGWSGTPRWASARRDGWRGCCSGGRLAAAGSAASGKTAAGKREQRTGQTFRGKTWKYGDNGVVITLLPKGCHAFWKLQDNWCW